MAVPTKLVLLLFSLLAFSTITEARKQKLTRLQFYMHDIESGPNATAVRVTGRLSNYTGSDPIAAMFGSVSVMDNPLTETPEPNSTLIGRAQGVYATTSSAF